MQQNGDLTALGLPKWPMITVVSMMSRKLTFEEAADILIRTDKLNFSTNNKSDYLDKCKIVGLCDVNVNFGSRQLVDAYEKNDARRTQLRVIDLEYVNNDQISTNSILGLHGWLNWDGEIGCTGFNIGKWPSVDEVLNEWSRIAIEWPFLSLRCQLFNDESSEQQVFGFRPLVEFCIHDGVAIAYRPFETLTFNGKFKYQEFSVANDTLIKAINVVDGNSTRLTQSRC